MVILDMANKHTTHIMPSVGQVVPPKDSLKPAAEIRLEPEAAPIPAEAAASLWV